MRIRFAAIPLLAALAGCGTSTHSLNERPDDQPSLPKPVARYTPEAGRDAATIASMRASPPPASAEISIGRNADGDAARLTAQGFVRIGSARYTGDEAAVRASAGDDARNVGADQVFLYAGAANERADAAWLAQFYVRFKLAFGATFRDLHDDERASVGGGGVQIGSVVGGTPAARANLQSGDFVTMVDGKPFANKAAFQAALRAGIGRSVTLTVVRNGETLQRMVRLNGDGGAVGKP